MNDQPAATPLADPGPYARSLAELSQRVRDDIAYLGEETPNWVPERSGTDCDVLVVGGGQSGMAIGFLLRRAGIARLRIVDAAPEGREGVWLTTARMRTLRSTKTLPGPELGIAALSFRAWFETLYGQAAYAALERASRQDWAAYLSWYRQATGTRVENDTRVTAIRPDPNGIAVELIRDGQAERCVTRKLVLATGMGGSGRMYIPETITDTLDPARYAHTDTAIDFARLKGKRIGVLGAASSAFDVAATALEQGAARADLFCRHDDLNRVTPIKGMAYAGVMDHYHELPDARKWELMRYFFARAAGPIAATVRRATALPGFHLHFGQSWQRLAQNGDSVVVETEAGQHEFDFIVTGTGYVQEVTERPELAVIAGDIALWRDRFQPEDGVDIPALSSYPYLGPGFEFLERQPGTQPVLGNIHCYTYGASLSHGRAVGEIASLRHGVPRLVQTIGRDLFLADWSPHRDRLMSYDTPDLTGAEYGRAPG
ncbi:SidA/IucD/PvdA family monooxygenase [Pseudodonghicola flavimaris]|uniref:NAD(P)/FAD-dependent oxidoreductase n=1 Tax=Pseudodonghicola flavimaris TaxID=3050036 RepID=A0ABT7EY73_9RHOB|nr:NAD(P)/FAD-dependent oxidoreductase [Pseudodonghicola flavimaris]MDK3017295.1 NAD(P)/FAD-dependent oxidoreductase [Pseudodonghicola flavimaris]